MDASSASNATDVPARTRITSHPLPAGDDGDSLPAARRARRPHRDNGAGPLIEMSELGRLDVDAGARG